MLEPTLEESEPTQTYFIPKNWALETGDQNMNKGEKKGKEKKRLKCG